MTIDITLHPAVETDNHRIRDLIHRVGINPMDLNWRHFVVAEDAYGHFMGCCQLKTHRDGSLELASLAVEDEYRRQGVARALIAHLLEHSPRPLYLMCRSALVPFYEKFGFQVSGAETMSPYFRRMHRLTKVLVVRKGNLGPTIMSLD
jgi:N-acetylglutamate synthase-like GNAT family acetyltransferase